MLFLRRDAPLFAFRSHVDAPAAIAFFHRVAPDRCVRVRERERGHGGNGTFVKNVSPKIESNGARSGGVHGISVRLLDRFPCRIWYD